MAASFSPLLSPPPTKIVYQKKVDLLWTWPSALARRRRCVFFHSLNFAWCFCEGNDVRLRHSTCRPLPSWRWGLGASVSQQRPQKQKQLRKEMQMQLPLPREREIPTKGSENRRRIPLFYSHHGQGVHAAGEGQRREQNLRNQQSRKRRHGGCEGHVRSLMARSML